MNIAGLPPTQNWLYVAACVLVPVAWGLAMVWVTNQLARRLLRRRTPRHEPCDAAPPAPTLEYHI